MNTADHLAQKEVCSPVTAEGCRAEVDEETILEGIGLNVHLHGTNRTTEADVVVAANHIERIDHRKNVSSALERSEAPVAQSPIAGYLGCGQAATHAITG